MKVCVKNLLRPARSLAFVFGMCPYRKFDESAYSRSTLGIVLQLINVMLTISVCVYIVLFLIPEAVSTKNEYSALRECTPLIIQTSQIFFSLWLTIHQFFWASKTLRCLRLADELNTTICRVSNLKRYPFAFYVAIAWTMMFLIKLPGIDVIAFTYFVTMLSTLFCETLVLEFVTVVCIALDTINQKLQSWQTSSNYDINDLKRLQSVYLKTAHLAEVVNDAFGISWLVSFLTKSIHIVLIGNWFFKLLEAMVVSRNKNTPINHLAYLLFRLATVILPCFHICYAMHQPAVKRSKMVSILHDMITRNSDNEMLITMNEFNLQVALRKMKFTAGGFFDVNLDHFREIMGMWFTLFVIIVQVTKS